MKAKGSITNKPEYYDVIPKYNGAGRLCNYRTHGDGGKVRVMADEWNRFCRLAGRQHEVIDGVAVFNPELEICTPDIKPKQISETERMIIETRLALAELAEMVVNA